MTRGDRANGADKIVHADVFEDVTMGSILNGRHHGCVFSVTGKDQNAKLRGHGQKSSTGISDCGVGKFDIKQDHVWGESLDDGDTLGDRSRFTDDRHVRFEVKQSAKPSTDHLVVINKNDTGLWLFHTGVNKGSKENSAVTCVPPPVLD